MSSNTKLAEHGVQEADIIALARSGEEFTILAVENKEDNKTDKAQNSIPGLRKISLGPGPFPELEKSYGARSLQHIKAQPDGSNPNVHVVVSVASGTELAKPFFSNLLSVVLDSLGLVIDVDYKVHYTRSANTITELSSSLFFPTANQGLAQRIILLSGDGGVIDIINELFSKARSATYVAPEIVLIPTGTGNALAHSSGLTKDNTHGLSSLARGTPKSLPLFKASFSPGSRLLTEEGTSEEELSLKDGKGNPVVYGAVVTSWGIHAGLVADSDTAEYRKFGAQRFGMAAKAALFPEDGGLPHIYRGKVSTLRGNGQWEALDRTEHAYVLSTLVSSLEKTFTISPASKPLSGELRLVHFGPLPGDEVMRLMGLAYQQGKHVEDGNVSYEAIEGLRIEFDEDEGKWRRVCVDGKIIRVEKGGWVEVRKEKAGILDLIALDN